jgi:hypothetical protein
MILFPKADDRLATGRTDDAIAARRTFVASLEIGNGCRTVPASNRPVTVA